MYVLENKKIRMALEQFAYWMRGGRWYRWLMVTVSSAVLLAIPPLYL